MDATHVEPEREISRRLAALVNEGGSRMSMGWMALEHLPPELNNFTNLTSLNIVKLQQLRDIQPLAGLTALEDLCLNRCIQIADFDPIATLVSLKNLDLSGCNQLKDITFLAGLSGLRKLDLSDCAQLQDLRPLIRLRSLTHLNLSGCWQIEDLTPLNNLSALRELAINHCTSVRVLPNFGLLQLKSLCGTGLRVIPPELLPSTRKDCLLQVRAWQRDLDLGEAPNSLVKLLVLGNGTVGKTQLCRRLLGLAFDTSISSTHGVSIGRACIVQASAHAPAVDANFWDFGGQDIYLGTHALFLDARAILLVAWTPRYENTDESEQNGVPMRNRPLAYWLEYLRSLTASDAPVIVVQTQCDRELDIKPARLPEQHGFERLCTTSSSAKEQEGMERLQLELKSAARYQFERYGKVRLPANWVAVEDEVRARIRDKTIPLEAFNELCKSRHGAAVPSVVLEYLHRSGQVFWREGLFGNQVVLDLAWALEGIYAVLERSTSLPLIRTQNGSFSPQLLALLVWQRYTEAERKLFLSFMEQCQTCFKVTDDVYIAPSLLPPQEKVSQAIADKWRGAGADVAVQLRYGFLHEGVLRDLLCKVGRVAGVHAVYWGYGVCFYDTESAVTVRIQADLPNTASGNAGGQILLEAVGARAGDMAIRLLETISSIRIGHPPKVNWLLGKPGEHLQARTRRLMREESGPPLAVLRPGPVPRPVEDPQPVYVSYAWGGKSDELVDEIERRLPNERFELVRTVLSRRVKGTGSS